MALLAGLAAALSCKRRRAYRCGRYGQAGDAQCERAKQFLHVDFTSRVLRFCRPTDNLASMLSFFFASLAIVLPGQTFPCTPVAVWDGDGPIWCEEGPRIRLSGIAAREIDETCSKRHPCPEASGAQAKAALVNLVGKPMGENRNGHTLVEGPTMRCFSAGGAGGYRTAAWCVSPKGGDLSCEMVRGGWALRWDRYWKGHRC